MPPATKEGEPHREYLEIARVLSRIALIGGGLTLFICLLWTGGWADIPPLVPIAAGVFFLAGMSTGAVAEIGLEMHKGMMKHMRSVK